VELNEKSQLNEVIEQQQLTEVKLHLGCGGKYLKGFINVDLYPYEETIQDSSRSGCVADVFQDIRYLELEDNTVNTIYSSHVLEHFVRWETIEMLKDWYRILKNGGELIVEMPDIYRCIMWLCHPRKEKRDVARKQFYGNQWDGLDYETHRYVWGGKEFKSTLQEIGFKRVLLSHKTTTHYSFRDMRIVATK